MEPAHARVQLRRTGGIAGLPVEAAVDTADLAPDQARSVLAALDAPELAALEDAPAPAPAMPDAFGYELEITRGDRTRRVRFGEHDAPEALRPLLALLRSRAKPASR